MGLPFDETKAIQAAALFLSLRGGKMSYLKLIKLLYIADRQALLKWGFPIISDRYVSMKNGPVLSEVYNLIVEDAPQEDAPKQIWGEYISAPRDYEVELLRDAGTDRLSRAEERLIREVFDEFGHWSRWDLVNHVHKFPEWKYPGNSSLPISIRDILRAGGESEGEINATLRELDSVGAAERALRNPA